MQHIILDEKLRAERKKGEFVSHYPESSICRTDQILIRSVMLLSCFACIIKKCCCLCGADNCWLSECSREQRRGTFTWVDFSASLVWLLCGMGKCGDFSAGSCFAS